MLKKSKGCLVHVFENMCFIVWKYVWKYLLVKKCVEICVMLFKNENMCLNKSTKQPLKVLNFKILVLHNSDTRKLFFFFFSKVK